VRPNAFAGAELDRVAERRHDGAWLRDPGARAVLTVEGRLAVDGEGAPLAVRLDAVEPLVGTAPVLLGERDGAPVAAVEGAVPPAGSRLAALRELAPVLGREEAAVAAYAVAMGNWHRRHRFCANCGAPSVPAESGHVRRCGACGAEHFPRTDPVVIMLVIDDERDRVLLGRQAAWTAGRYSCLAGFVEPGESLEEAVAREVFEEADVRVDTVAYRSSQPWPFPSSLMLGFTCRYAGGEPLARDGELEDLRWFRRDELAPANLPPPHAIARRLIDDWVERRL
jgi:NAD+ diphosphatase